MTYVIASSKDWRPELANNVQRRVGARTVRIASSENLSLDRLRALDAEIVFFTHWSEKISPEIYENFESVIFHMTDLPFGRGGSPLQNLISRGIYETKISAIRCAYELDAGPIYMKRDLSLHGSAQEIYMRASAIIEDMIVAIIKERPVPLPQEGDIVMFKRRKREDGDMESLRKLEDVHDCIRMLDANGYPRAYIETDNLVFEFSRSSLRGDHVVADVVIKRKSGPHEDK